MLALALGCLIFIFKFFCSFRVLRELEGTLLLDNASAELREPHNSLKGYENGSVLADVELGGAIGELRVGAPAIHDRSVGSA